MEEIWTILSQRLAELEEQQNDPVKNLTLGLAKPLTSTLFSTEIMAVEIHNKFFAPKFMLYEGTCDLIDHILYMR